MTTVVLSLGSNKGNSQTLLVGALGKLDCVLQDMHVSSLYKTKPQDYLLQADFFNLAVVGGYHSSAEHLLADILAIETAYGRERTKEIPKGPRYLDIDIIFFGSTCISTPSLTIPHPAFKKRCFVLVPILEMFPNYTDPVTGVPLRTILNGLEEQGVVYAGDIWNKQLQPITETAVTEGKK